MPKVDQKIANFEVGNNRLVLMSQTNATRRIQLQINSDDSVSLETVRYEGKPVKILCQTLYHVLSDLSKSGSTSSVQYAQFQTRAYRLRTIFEFRLRDNVVVLDCFSNGPDDLERLYVLDIEPSKDSLFWNR